jgi:hypothetical protein
MSSGGPSSLGGSRPQDPQAAQRRALEAQQAQQKKAAEEVQATGQGAPAVQQPSTPQSSAAAHDAPTVFTGAKLPAPTGSQAILPRTPKEKSRDKMPTTPPPTEAGMDLLRSFLPSGQTSSAQAASPEAAAAQLDESRLDPQPASPTAPGPWRDGYVLPSSVQATTAAAPAAPSKPASPQEQKLAEHVEKALTSGDSKDLATLREFAKELRNSKDPVLSDLGRAAEQVCKGIEVYNDPKSSYADKAKAIGSFVSAGFVVLRAGINGLEARGLMEKKTADEVRNYALSSFSTLATTVGHATKAIESFGKGEIRQGIQSLLEMSADGFKTAAPFLKAAGVSDDKIKAIESLVSGARDGLAKLNKGLELWDQKKYGEACKEWGGSVRDVALGLAPLLGKSAEGAGGIIGTLAKVTGDIAEAAPYIATMCDTSKGYFERLDAAQEALSRVGVAALRGLACKAFGEKIGNNFADGVEWVRKKAVGYDQETGKTWREAITQNDKAWNATIENGEMLAGLMGFRRGDEAQKTANPDEYMAMENFAEFWASNNKDVGKAKADIFDTLRAEGPQAAKAKYLKFMNEHRGERLIRGW